MTAAHTANLPARLIPPGDSTGKGEVCEWWWWVGGSIVEMVEMIGKKEKEPKRGEHWKRERKVAKRGTKHEGEMVVQEFS